MRFAWTRSAVLAAAATFAAAAAGTHSLSESYVYTIEAFEHIQMTSRVVGAVDAWQRGEGTRPWGALLVETRKTSSGYLVIAAQVDDAWQRLAVLIE